jgi:DNA-binding NarL/FixJ family response regulator
VPSEADKVGRSKLDLDPIRVCVRDATRMGTQLLADALRRDRRFEIVDVENVSQDSFISGGIHVLVLFCSGESNEQLELVRKIRAVSPDMKVIALLDDRTPKLVLRAFRAGVRGIFCRNDSYKALAKCVIKVHSGHIWATQSEVALLVAAIGQPFPLCITDAKGATLLSPREEHVVHWVAEGLTNREIADRMQLSEHTVKNYLFRIFDKLGVSSRSELVMYALSHAAASPPNSSQRTFQCSAAVLAGNMRCDVDVCPLAHLQLGQAPGEDCETFPGCELAYLRLSIAAAVSALVHKQSSVELLKLEQRLPASRLTELRKRAHDGVQKALDVISTSDSAGNEQTRGAA